MIGIMLLARVACCVIAWRLIVPGPALFALALAASLTVAFAVAGRATGRVTGKRWESSRERIIALTP